MGIGTASPSDLLELSGRHSTTLPDQMLLMQMFLVYTTEPTPTNSVVVASFLADNGNVAADSTSVMNAELT